MGAVGDTVSAKVGRALSSASLSCPEGEVMGTLAAEAVLGPGQLGWGLPARCGRSLEGTGQGTPRDRGEQRGTSAWWVELGWLIRKPQWPARWAVVTRNLQEQPWPARLPLWVPFCGNKGKGFISHVRDCPKCKDKRSNINHFSEIENWSDAVSQESSETRGGHRVSCRIEVSCEQALFTTQGVGDF